MSNEFAFFDLILFAGVAAFLIYRLRAVLGQRHGDERTRDPFAPPPPPTPPAGMAPGPGAAPPPYAPPPFAPAGTEPDVARTGLNAGIEQIMQADPAFRASDFLGGARTAFQMIVTAFAAGDKPTLQTLLSDRLYQLFAGAVDDRISRGLTAETVIERIMSAEILAARVENGQGQITVRFESEQMNVVRNAAGAVVEGDPDRLTKIEDVWTFARALGSGNPNWQLIQTGVRV